LLGEGCFGQVYDIPNSNMVFKQMKSENMQEMSIHSCLKHKNIIELFDIKLEPCGLVMAKAEMNLHSLINSIKKGERIRFCLDISEGMEYLYSQNPPIHHRDLKSKNVLLFSDKSGDRLVICDFGISNLDGSNVDKNLDYLTIVAPERIPSDDGNNFLPEFDQKCDVYSFSMIMWELFTWQTLDKEVLSTYGDFQSWKSDIGDGGYAGVTDLFGRLSSPKRDFLRKVKEGWRPSLNDTTKHQQFVDLMKSCWDNDPKKRPTFQQITQKLHKMEAFNDESLILPNSLQQV